MITMTEDNKSKYSEERNKQWCFDTKDSELSYEKRLIMTEEDVKASTDKYMKDYRKLVSDFEQKTKLNKLDLSIMVFAAGFQVIRWAMISNSSLFGDKIQRPDAKNVDKFVDKVAKKAGNATQSVIDTVPFLPPTLPELVESLFLHQVPYDAIKTSDHFKFKYGDLLVFLKPGLSGTNHRYKTLGHDPIAGFIFGTANIATNTLSVNNPLLLYPSYHVKNMEIDELADLYHILKRTYELEQEKPEVVGGALITQAVHIGTDIFTKASLPIPLINVISPETSKFLMGRKIDTLSVTRSAGLAILINKIVEMFHKLFYDKTGDIIDLYEAKTRKVVMYSNVISSLLNTVYVTESGDLNRLDVGGTAVAIWKVLTNEKKIREIKSEFIKRELDNDFAKEEDEIKQRLAIYGFEY